MIELLLEFYNQISGFSFILGFLLIAHSYNRKNYIKRLLEGGIQTNGKVVEIYQNPGSLFSKEPGEGFAPVVEYETISGNIVKHHSTTYRKPSTYHVGQIVQLWYINYKSQREATLEDDEPGSLPDKLLLIGIVLMCSALTKILSGLSGLV